MEFRKREANRRKMYNKLAEKTTNLMFFVIVLGVIGSVIAGLTSGLNCSVILGIVIGFFGILNTFIGCAVLYVVRKLIAAIEKQIGE